MSIYSIFKGTSAVILGAGVLSTPALAEVAEAASTRQVGGLEEVTVSARRTEESAVTVPVAVVALSADALSQRNVAQVSDLQFSVPNLQIKPSNIFPSVPEFILRGQRQTLFTDENVVTYVNSVPQSTRGVTLYDLQNVQVLKGPQGTLFGKNSNGGAVVLTTREPGWDLEGKIDLDVGNYNLRKVTAVANLPLVDDTAALRFAGQSERRDGVLKNTYPGGDDLNDRSNESGRITLLLTPVDKLESLTTIDGMHRDEIPIPSVIEAAPLSSNPLAPLTQQAVLQQSMLGGSTPKIEDGNLVRRGDPSKVRMPTGRNTTVETGGSYDPISTFASKVNIWGISNNTSYELTDELTLRNILSYRYERALDRQDPSGVSGFPVIVGLNGGTPVFGPFVDNNTNYFNRDRTYTEELQLAGDTEYDNFITGLFYSHVDHFSTVTSNLFIGPFDAYQVGPRYGETRVKTDSTAVFAQTTHNFGAIGLDALNLTLGVRYTWDKRDYRTSNFFTNGNQSVEQDFVGGSQVCNMLNGSGSRGTGVNTATDCFMTGDRLYNEPTWTISLDYQFSPDAMAYFTTRRGFKSGSSNPTTRNLDFAMYDLERLTDYELGFKNQGRVASMPYRFDISAFYGKYDDIQTGDILTFCAVSDCSSTYTDLIIFNTGKATIKGAELNATIKPVQPLELSVSYSYQQARYDSGAVLPQPTNPAFPISTSNPIDLTGGIDLSGEDIPGVPERNLSVAAAYTLDFIPATFANTVLTVNYSYRSSATGNGAIGVYKTPSFGVTNARLSFENIMGSSFSLALWSSNITDESYSVSCNDNLGSLAYATCKWGEPRTYGLTATAEF